MNRETFSASGGTLKCCSTHATRFWPVSKLFALPVCWFPREVGSVCDKCTEGRVLLQYASNSSSPRPCDPSGHWSPREAEGTIPDIFANVTLISGNFFFFFISRYLCRPNVSNIPHSCKIQKSKFIEKKEVIFSKTLKPVPIKHNNLPFSLVKYISFFSILLPKRLEY